MSHRVVAAVTLGQSPRADILDEMRALVPDVNWIEQGALDGLEEPELARLVPQLGEFPLVTRVRAGRPIVVGDVAIRPLLQRAIDRVAADADLAVVLCSTPVSLQTRLPLLYPDRLLSATVASLASSNLVAVVTPRADQVRTQRDRWQRLGLRSVVLHASPFGDVDYESIGWRARKAGASLIVLDCFSYSGEVKARLEEASGLPTILARSIVASIAGELARPATRGSRREQAVTVPRTVTQRPAGAAAVVRSFPAPVRRSTKGVDTLADHLRAHYALGLIGPGDRIPSVRRLARQLRISPTTVADWYRQLHAEGVLTSKKGSGTYLKSFAMDHVLRAGNAPAIDLVNGLVQHFRLIGLSLRDAADLLAVLSDGRHVRMKAGCLMPLELFESVFASADARLGFAFPRTFLSPFRTYPQLRRQLSADPSVRTILTTHLHYAIAERLATDLRLGMLVLQLDTRTANILAGRPRTRRHVILRDPDAADVIRSLAGVLAPPQSGTVVVGDLDEPGEIFEAHHAGTEIVVSPAAFASVRTRVLHPEGLKVWRPQLSEHTVRTLLNTYFVAHLEQGAEPHLPS
ncbi:MAG TPA: AroM family protein [Vicinamibacterales bacterium]